MEDLVFNDAMLASAIVLTVTFVGIFTEYLHGFERSKVARGIGEAEVQLRRRREPVAERPESVAELHLEAPPLEAIIVGRELRKRRPPELRKRCSPGPF